jgi:hypothetical protein
MPLPPQMSPLRVANFKAIIGLFGWLMAGGDLFWEKSTADWLVTDADLF